MSIPEQTWFFRLHPPEFAARIALAASRTTTPRPQIVPGAPKLPASINSYPKSLGNQIDVTPKTPIRSHPVSTRVSPANSLRAPETPARPVALYGCLAPASFKRIPNSRPKLNCYALHLSVTANFKKSPQPNQQLNPIRPTSSNPTMPFLNQAGPFTPAP